ncbi:TetR/AcrR family transcriptional regulator [Saccharopolyspora erythraea]|uniref:TetR/AcrR family transcriptional regulator n=1 Tax=Saccharopolyspora erythraea TaxID=1836 RepID=UPI001BAA9B68|nr:TetR/AcrR family transcriptional regulator [Saccharopolyspora erythraea]QUH02913.1 TetR/AcrR family transcriptional regulator [Saccharopolyspora erythraea]
MTDDAAVPALTGGALTRSRILDAAARLMSTAGIVRTTTKEIARAAGCSEAALYKHFQDKEEIFVRVLHERAPRLAQAVTELPGRAGDGDVAGHLREVVGIAVGFYRESFPMAASLFASPELLAAHRRKLAPGTGPEVPTRHLADYLRAEQRLGRVAADVNADAAATLLIGACFHRAFLDLFFSSAAQDDEQFAADIVHAALDGIAADNS